MRERHVAKIRQLKESLEGAGYYGLDQQATALGLSRSTTWVILAGKYKASGLSVSTIKRILRQSELDPIVRRVIVDYVAEKVAGRYGHTEPTLRKFWRRLNSAALEDTSITTIP